jgi:hypothetical protein
MGATQSWSERERESEIEKMGEALKLLNLTWHPLKNNFFHFSTCAFRRTPRTLLIRASSSSTTASGRNRRSSAPSSSTSTSDREAVRAIRLKKVPYPFTEIVVCLFSLSWIQVYFEISIIWKCSLNNFNVGLYFYWFIVLVSCFRFQASKFAFEWNHNSIFFPSTFKLTLFTW